MTITGVDFFNTELPGGTLDSGTFSFSLAYTSRSPGGLDLTNPLNNITSGSQAFFSGSLPGLLGGILDITGTPFLYNPTLGNLLLTVTVSGAVDGSPLFAFLDFSQTQVETSRAVFRNPPFGNIGNDGGALVTKFVTSPVPEPSSVFSLATALGIFLFARLLKRSRII